VEELIMRRFISALVIVGLCASGSAVFAQDSGAKEEAKKAGQATKEAGKDTADAAKHIGKATVKRTKKRAPPSRTPSSVTTSTRPAATGRPTPAGAARRRAKNTAA
jgi:hypothetical protein